MDIFRFQVIFFLFLEQFAGGLACLAQEILLICFWSFARERERKGNPGCGWHPVIKLPQLKTSAATNQCHESRAYASAKPDPVQTACWHQGMWTCIYLNIWTSPSFRLLTFLYADFPCSAPSPLACILHRDRHHQTKPECKPKFRSQIFYVSLPNWPEGNLKD